MELGMIGLGKMGMNMVFRLLEGGHKVVVFNRTLSKEEIAINKGAIGSNSIKEFVSKLTPPRVIWLMVPAGQPTDDMPHSSAAVNTAGMNLYWNDRNLRLDASILCGDLSM